jgi:hypothetical protein
VAVVMPVMVTVVVIVVVIVTVLTVKINAVWHVVEVMGGTNFSHFDRARKGLGTLDRFNF